MKRKQAAASPSHSLAKKQKRERQHRDLDTRPLSSAASPTAKPSPGWKWRWTARFDSFHSHAESEFEPKPKSYCAQPRRQSDCWNSSGESTRRLWCDARLKYFKSITQSEFKFPLLRRSLSLPNISDLRSLPLVARLSKHNIQAMSSNPTQPLTPAKSTSSKSHSQFSPSKSSTSNLNPARAAEKLQWADILDEDAGEEALALRPELRERIEQIVNGERRSSMKPGSVQKFRSTKKQMASRNEATIATRLMPFLVKEKRSASRQGEDELDLQGLAACSDEAAPEVMSQSFETDGLDWNISAPFHSNSVPIPVRLSHSSQASAELGLKNPAPDLTYGFQRSEFSSDELRLLSQSGLEVAKDIVSPFFVVEWKAWRGNLLDAKVQARRAGAAMVWGRRRARDAIKVAGAVPGMHTGAGARVIEDLDSGLGSPMDLDATRTAEGEQPRTSPARVFSTSTQARDDDYPDSDLNAIAFSCVISPDIVFFYVHWAEESQASPLNSVAHPASAAALPNSFSESTFSDTNSTLQSSFSSLAANPSLPQYPKYHTALLAKHFLDAESVSNIRICMHNILEWGLERRKAAVKNEADALVQAEEKGRVRTREELRGIEERIGKKRKI